MIILMCILFGWHCFMFMTPTHRILYVYFSFLLFSRFWVFCTCRFCHPLFKSSSHLIQHCARKVYFRWLHVYIERFYYIRWPMFFFILASWENMTIDVTCIYRIFKLYDAHYFWQGVYRTLCLQKESLLF